MNIGTVLAVYNTRDDIGRPPKNQSPTRTTEHTKNSRLRVYGLGFVSGSKYGP